MDENRQSFPVDRAQRNLRNAERSKKGSRNLPEQPATENRLDPRKEEETKSDRCNTYAQKITLSAKIPT